ncbi:MAG: 2'-5' RNA ligase family protein [Dorea sp.]|nr:2'-5' RNA ligase family protein [Dorea sp.]
MYLVSLYFDSQTEKTLRKHMEKVAVKTGNAYMAEHRIPPHLTIAACENCPEEELISALEECSAAWRAGAVDWVAIGCFKPHVLFLEPVLNQYLHDLCVSVNTALDRFEGAKRKSRYQPFGWMPHAAVARRLTEKQMLTGFHVLQTNFSPFSGKGVKIGLARSSPYQNLKTWDLQE